MRARIFSIALRTSGALAFSSLRDDARLACQVATIGPSATQIDRIDKRRPGGLMDVQDVQVRLPDPAPRPRGRDRTEVDLGDRPVGAAWRSACPPLVT